MRHFYLALFAVISLLPWQSQAAIPGADGTIAMCYVNLTGTTRVIDYDSGARCIGLTETQINMPSGLPPSRVVKITQTGGVLTGTGMSGVDIPLSASSLTLAANEVAELVATATYDTSTCVGGFGYVGSSIFFKNGTFNISADMFDDNTGGPTYTGGTSNSPKQLIGSGTHSIDTKWFSEACNTSGHVKLSNFTLIAYIYKT